MSNQAVYWDAPASRWDTGLRWSTAEPGQTKKKHMANIAINTSKLPIANKLVKGQEIITNSTANQNVPGNAALVTAFTNAQTALTATNAAFEDNRQAAKTLMSARETSLVNWNIALTGLAGFTEAATEGDAEKIQSAGFDVRGEPTPPAPVTQIENVKVGFTGMPGHSLVRWKRQSNADAYVVERCADPTAPVVGWENLATVTEAKYEGNGVIPGQKCWYRVAGVNRRGQGPWSEPALRPVM